MLDVLINGTCKTVKKSPVMANNLFTFRAFCGKHEIKGKSI